MDKNLRVIQYGLGPIGCAAARQVTSRPGLELVGGVDIDPAKVGQDLGIQIGLPKKMGIPIAPDLAQCLENGQADVVVHTTQSYFDLFERQILEILEAGLDVVSTSEELVFPWHSHPEMCEKIDRTAKGVGKRVLATGVNPGFIMDTLPLLLTGISQRVERIEVTRLVNASARRGPFQAKIGSGLTPEEFNARVEAGRMGHVGLAESVGMVFDTLGKDLVRFETSVEPLLAEKQIQTSFFSVEPGQVQGLRQVAHAYTPEGEFMSLIFQAALECEVEGDTIKIHGQPELEVKLRGTNGDIATVAIAVNAIRSVKEASPGLHTMRDVPLVTFWS